MCGLDRLYVYAYNDQLRALAVSDGNTEFVMGDNAMIGVEMS